MGATNHGEHKSHKKQYFIVFAALAILTVLELIIPELNTTTFLKSSSLTILAVGKAFLVAYFFMHLNEETKWMKFIAAIPISAAFYATMVCCETLFR
jgi:caa(3)-type oxidase subunit IV